MPINSTIAIAANTVAMRFSRALAMLLIECPSAGCAHTSPERRHPLSLWTPITLAAPTDLGVELGGRGCSPSSVHSDSALDLAEVRVDVEDLNVVA